MSQNEEKRAPCVLGSEEALGWLAPCRGQRFLSRGRHQVWLTDVAGGCGIAGLWGSDLPFSLIM